MILFGTILATWILPELNLWEAAALATILTPTDPALSQAVVNSRRVPIFIRQTINVESGLNDGICLPILFIFFSLAEITNQPEKPLFWLEFTAKQILLGPLIGIVIGYLSGWLITQSVQKQFINNAFESLLVLGISVLAYSGAEVIGGNGLIAAFFAGLAIGNTAESICQCLYEFGEAEGQLLILLIFLLFGATMIPPSWEQLNWEIIVYTIMSLTVVRFLAVTISFLGLKLQPITILFVGWFGPRGVASVLYGLLLLEKQAIFEQQIIFSTVMITILTSIFIHGLTAFPAVNWYGKQMEQVSEHLPEMKVVSELPVRLPWRNSQNES